MRDESEGKVPQFRIGLLCSGPSLERGISLNSARCVCDHLQSDVVAVVPIYFSRNLDAYTISVGQLYSNTPSDFDFKVAEADPLGRTGLVELLRSLDLVFPVIHGKFGEDGTVQALLEDLGIPYVGPDPEACRRCFDKFRARSFLKRHGYHTMPMALIERDGSGRAAAVGEFFAEHGISKAVVKPAQGGSSIAVNVVSSVGETLRRIDEILSRQIDERVVVEPFCKGREFTVIILENAQGRPVALAPCEIAIDDRGHEVFDYRRKYLPTSRVTYHCPPRFPDEVVGRIQEEGERFFQEAGLRDFTRIDGWFLPDGRIWFSDINPISGMEQNSFLFIQAARMGMSHREVLQVIVENACRRYRIRYPGEGPSLRGGRVEVQVLFGGETTERQVSMMSGTNVWLKLRRSKRFRPTPFLLDTESRVWRLPYAYALNHTVEEVMQMCRDAVSVEGRLGPYRRRFYRKMGEEALSSLEDPVLPTALTLKEFASQSPFVFIALHGGFGENGTLQRLLEAEGVPFNGSGSKTSRLCIDKLHTGQRIAHLASDGILTAEKATAEMSEFSVLDSHSYARFWDSLVSRLSSDRIIVKPIDDGCSAGIALLGGARDLQRYVEHARAGDSHIPSGTLTQQDGIIEMPSTPMKRLLFERFVVTDRVSIVDQSLQWEARSGWIEITVGVLEGDEGLEALSPSITVVEGSLLSLEEKFQGGTGVNITPPPAAYVSPRVVELVMRRIEKVAGELGIEGYGRIDAFMHIESGEIIVIEANTIPGLTPSTVIFQQALAEDPPLYPTEFLERITKRGIKRGATANRNDWEKRKPRRGGEERRNQTS